MLGREGSLLCLCIEGLCIRGNDRIGYGTVCFETGRFECWRHILDVDTQCVKYGISSLWIWSRKRIDFQRYFRGIVNRLETPNATVLPFVRRPRL